jgi:hypothetical protein
MSGQLHIFALKLDNLQEAPSRSYIYSSTQKKNAASIQVVHHTAGAFTQSGLSFAELFITVRLGPLGQNHDD